MSKLAQASLIAGLVTAIAVPASAQFLSRRAPRVKSHHQVASDVARMVGNQGISRMLKQHRLNLVNVMWEDTGRDVGSSVGPNISDVTIEVEAETSKGRKQQFLMPVMRFPNFTDKTGDVAIDKFFIRVGNERDGRKLRTVSLREFLRRPTRYMSLPGKGKIKGGTLLARRDRKVLTSAQAAFLPIRRGGKTRFWPVIFNYQSYDKNPAVLTILVTRQGTSMTIIDNARDTVATGGSWGQRLYFNAHGKRAPLIAEREKDVVAKGITANGESAASLGDDANLMMIIQIPLKLRRRRQMQMANAGPAPMADAKVASKSTSSGEESDVDRAVIGHGPAEGPYTELDGLTIQRDARFPVRVTVQFYQATSNGVVSRKDIERLAKKIDRVYKHADYVGSLVVPRNDVRRPTMWSNTRR